MNLTNNAGHDKHGYSRYGIRFDEISSYLRSDGSSGDNITIFGADTSSPTHIDNKNKNIVVPGEGPTQRLDDTTIKAEAKCPINSTQSGKRFVLSLHYKRNNSFLFLNAVKMYQIKAKDSEIKPYEFC